MSNNPFEKYRNTYKDKPVVHAIIEDNKEECFDMPEMSNNDINFLDFFGKMQDSINKEELVLLDKYKVSKLDLMLVKDAVLLRENVNSYLKNMSNIESYKRKNQEVKDKIDFQAMLVEMLFSKYVWEKYKYTSKYLKTKLTIKSPEIASVFLNHEKEDFFIKHGKTTLNFDVKSQFLNNRYEAVNINQGAHARFTQHNSDFYIVGLIDGNPQDFDTVENIYFVLMPIAYFNKFKTDINEPRTPTQKFSPYYHLDINKFKYILTL